MATWQAHDRATATLRIWPMLIAEPRKLTSIGTQTAAASFVSFTLASSPAEGCWAASVSQLILKGSHLNVSCGCLSWMHETAISIFSLYTTAQLQTSRKAEFLATSLLWHFPLVTSSVHVKWQKWAPCPSPNTETVRNSLTIHRGGESLNTSWTSVYPSNTNWLPLTPSSATLRTLQSYTLSLFSENPPAVSGWVCVHLCGCLWQLKWRVCFPNECHHVCKKWHFFHQACNFVRSAFFSFSASWTPSSEPRRLVSSSTKPQSFKPAKWKG